MRTRENYGGALSQSRHPAVDIPAGHSPVQGKLLTRWSPGSVPPRACQGARRMRTGSPGRLPRLPAVLHTAAAQALKGVQAQPACVRGWSLHAVRLAMRWSVGQREGSVPPGHRSRRRVPDASAPAVGTPCRVGRPRCDPLGGRRSRLGHRCSSSTVCRPALPTGEVSARHVPSSPCASLGDLGVERQRATRRRSAHRVTTGLRPAGCRVAEAGASLVNQGEIDRRRFRRRLRAGVVRADLTRS
ncbi:hypothetical protein QFZ43_005966 [Streptomyces afghaniensis]|nr:hypothetical protein [Streptomyces afghaniensis]